MGQNEKKYSILDELAKCSGFDIALMTTFNFEIGFFERAVLNRLYAKDVRQVSLFVDSKELTGALNELDIKHHGSNIGRKYMVNPVRMDSSFHPKVILLLGKKKARLFVGSANIKTSGYAINNEAFNFIDYSPEHPESLDVIVAAIDFFSEINEISYKLDNEIIKASKEFVYYHKSNKNPNMNLLHNMTRPILGQVAELIDHPVKSIRIAVPYYDKELKALRAVKETFPDADIQLYVQNEYSTFPVEYNERNGIAKDIKTFTGFKDNDTSSSGNFYHGKVFLFKTAAEEFVLYGSANCTQAALTKTYLDGGNVECDLFEKGAPGEFDYYFENMKVEKKAKLVSQPMVFTNTEQANFIFKYGEVKGDTELHIDYSARPGKVEVKIGEIKLESRFKGDELNVVIPEKYGNILSEIFDITIVFDGKTETLRCWTFSPADLSSNRAKRDNREEFVEFDIDATGDKYREDRIRFLKAEATCFSEWQAYKETQKYMNQIKQEQEGDDGEAEDFIIDFEIPDEYRAAYKQYAATARYRGMFVRRFLGLPVLNDPEQKSKTQTGSEVDEERPRAVKPRKATTDEKSFEHFIKGKVRGMLNDLYVEVVELDHYIGIVQVVMEIFDKYNNEDIVEDIFTKDYVLYSSVSFLNRILIKSFDEYSQEPEKQGALIQKCLYTILDGYCYYRDLEDDEERYELEAVNRSLLFNIEKLYTIRTIYPEYLKGIYDVQSRTVLPISYDSACSYIENLYGFKTKPMLKAFIRKYYVQAKIWKDEERFYIEEESNDITKHLTPSAEVIREIVHYSREVSRVSVIIITVTNIAPNPERKNVMKTIKHTITPELHKWRRSITRENGDTMDDKAQYIEF